MYNFSLLLHIALVTILYESMVTHQVSFTMVIISFAIAEFDRHSREIFLWSVQTEGVKLKQSSSINMQRSTMR